MHALQEDELASDIAKGHVSGEDSEDDADEYFKVGGGGGYLRMSMSVHACLHAWVRHARCLAPKTVDGWSDA
jgi:hypothetical protein